MNDFSYKQDLISDELIRTITSASEVRSAQDVAARKLYDRHKIWVEGMIRRRVFEAADVEDIAQAVWIYVLTENHLAENYVRMTGNFRAYLRKPINWEILKHIRKLRIIRDERGEKRRPAHWDVDSLADAELEDSLLGHMSEDLLDQSHYEDVMEKIIKHNLPNLDLKPRYCFVTSEYESLFGDQASEDDVAQMNGISVSSTRELLAGCAGKDAHQRSDRETAVYVPTHYRKLVEHNKVGGIVLANVLGVTHNVFRKQLSIARKKMLELVRQNMFVLNRGDFDE